MHTIVPNFHTLACHPYDNVMRSHNHWWKILYKSLFLYDNGFVFPLKLVTTHRGFWVQTNGNRAHDDVILLVNSKACWNFV